MLSKTISFLIVFLLIIGVIVWILAAFEPFQKEAFIEEKIERIEVYDAKSTDPSTTITDQVQIKEIVECINECEREEMHETASYAAVDVTLIMYSNNDDYEVGVYQGDGNVSFVYDATIIDSELEPFPM
ncbi:hypothetical protein [Terribacillus saccharophilus]|uniref:Uncharacterized protein n=1 Tax=Terribacillus saccharophilus TaxID=361277 RepID=A0A268ABF9_9BACI|nr:hypothetical protein [Terribacillus saccharophilus]PAD21471.1 hypothetical protein CHH64_08195 [Terribacillus saccharophilus]